VARLREEAAARAGEVVNLRDRIARLEAEVVERSGPPPLAFDDGAAPAVVAELEAKLGEALRRAADAEAAQEARTAPSAVPPPDGDAAESLRRAIHERDSLATQIAERDGKISRLQREVADKTDRLGRLAKEVGELKAKGLGKIFR
jgi:hypothetical protein